MADQALVDILKQGSQVWNKWREEHSDVTDPDLSGANLSEIDLVGANLHSANLEGANLEWSAIYSSTLNFANLTKANLSHTEISGSFLLGTNLTDTKLIKANLSKSFLRGARLINADLQESILYGCDFFDADLTGATLYRADLSTASLVETNIDQAVLTECNIFGISVWNLKGTPKDQSNLHITSQFETRITVDDIRVAQFIHLLLNNENIRNVIDTITSKAVLILGRFSDEHLPVLDAIRTELRRLGLAPILFDFKKPVSKDVTGTVETLARMARFIIADLTDPSSIPHELATLVPLLRTTPIQLIKMTGSTGYGMIEDYIGSYKWIIPTYEYADKDSLIANLSEVIQPAHEMAKRFREQ